MSGLNLKKTYLVWIAIVTAAIVALILSLFKPSSGIFSPPTEPITKDSWLGVVARSRSESSGQIYVIPTKYNVMDDSWILEENENPSHFLKKDLERFTKKYGTSLNELKKKYGNKYKDKGNKVEIITGHTTHRYPYDYDINIPLIFYSPKYVVKGKFEQFVTQQHIVPTMAVATGGPIPTGAKGRPLQEIFTRDARGKSPKVVVLISIDMGGDQFFEAHPEATPNIDDIRNNGADFINAQVSHLDVETGPGHVAIGTGSYPANSIVYGNYLWRSKTHEASALFSTKDKNYDPVDLKVPTFADEFDKAMKNKPVVISYCYAARASMGMAGHGAQFSGGDKDLVFWISNETFTPDTNTNFYKELPEEIKSLNAVRNFVEQYPDKTYMGHKIIKSDGSYNKYYLFSSPAQVKLDGDMIISLMESENVGKDSVTDLVFATFKSTDYAGHEFGWESIEAKETFREVDKQIGRIRDWLDTNLNGDYLMIITADHGAAPLPEISGGIRMNVDLFKDEFNSLFDPKEKRVLLYMSGNNYFFDEERMKTLGISFDTIKDYFLNYTREGKRVFNAIFLLPEIEAEQKRLLSK